MKKPFIQPIQRENILNILVIIAAPIFFWLVYIGHFYIHEPDLIPTGFIAGDMPMYSAFGREIFENGNGFAYPNPYNPNSPAIYFQWLFWIFGFGIKVLGFDPGYQFVVFGIVCGFIVSWVTFKIVETILPDRRFVRLLFLLVMWGGGVLVLGKVFFNLITGLSLGDNLFLFDPFNGAWGLNWGRSLIYPPEALYHLLFSSTWFFLLRKRWNLAILSTFLLASTHPFSGVQLTLIVLVYFIFLSVFEKSNKYLIHLGLTTLVLGFLFGYNFLYLNTFEQHTSVYQIVSLKDWVLPWNSLLLAYLPIGILAIWRIIRDKGKFDTQVWLFIVSFIVSIGLVKHDLLIEQPIQPLHFTRGYVWTPLMLLALPLIQNSMVKLYSKRSKVIANSLIAVCFFLAVFDNLTFVRLLTFNGHGENYLTPGEREMFVWMDENDTNGVMLSSKFMTGYLAATYTEMTPYLGHWLLTPNWDLRSRQVADWLETGATGDWFNQINFILFQNIDIPAHLEIKNWKIIHENEEWLLFQRKP